MKTRKPWKAPVGGYEFTQKDIYRRQIWNLGRAYRLQKGRVLLMPSREGLEIEVARNKGIRTRQMYLVDYNRATAAHLTRAYPERAESFGCSAVEAIRRIAASNERLSFANFDFTSQLNMTDLRGLAEMTNLNVWEDRSGIAVTMQRGREKRGVFELLIAASGAQVNAGLRDMNQSLTPRDIAALSVVATVLTRRDSVAVPRAAGVYKSSAGQLTMLWCFFLKTKPVQDMPMDIMNHRTEILNADSRPPLEALVQIDGTRYPVRGLSLLDRFVVDRSLSVRDQRSAPRIVKIGRELVEAPASVRKAITPVAALEVVKFVCQQCSMVANG